MLQAHKASLLCVIISVISQQLYRLALTGVQFMSIFSLQNPFVLQKS